MHSYISKDDLFNTISKVFSYLEKQQKRFDYLTSISFKISYERNSGYESKNAIDSRLKRPIKASEILKNDSWGIVPISLNNTVLICFLFWIIIFLIIPYARGSSKEYPFMTKTLPLSNVHLMYLLNMLTCSHKSMMIFSLILFRA